MNLTCSLFANCKNVMRTYTNTSSRRSVSDSLREFLYMWRNVVFDKSDSILHMGFQFYRGSFQQNNSQKHDKNRFRFQLFMVCLRLFFFFFLNKQLNSDVLNKKARSKCDAFSRSTIFGII